MWFGARVAHRIAMWARWELNFCDRFTMHLLSPHFSIGEGIVLKRIDGYFSADLLVPHVSVLETLDTTNITPV